MNNSAKLKIVGRRIAMAYIVAAAVLALAFPGNPPLAVGVLLTFLVAGAVMDSWIVTCTCLATLFGGCCCLPDIGSHNDNERAWNDLGNHIIMYFAGIVVGIVIDELRTRRRNRESSQ
jgi:hypothetical protein